MQSLSRFITKYYKIIATIWCTLFIAFAFFAIQLPGQLQGDGFKVDGDHQAVMDELTEDFGIPAESIFVVFDGVSDKDIKMTLQKIEQLDDVVSIQSPLDVAKLHKKDVSYAVLNFDNTVDDMSIIVTDIRDKIADKKGVAITGGSVISSDINTASQKDLANAEAIGLPIAILVLLLAFGSVVASILPIAIGVVTVVSAFGILSMLSGQFELSIFVLNIIPMLGLALSIDFALLFINRYREERLHSTVEQAVQTTIQTAGRSIIFSAFCVMIGLGAMIVIQVEIFHNIALGGTIAVFLAVVASLTLLPASILLLGDRLNKWTIIRVKPSSVTRWHSFATFVMKRPITVVIISLIILGIGIIPVKDMKLTIPQMDALPTSYDARTSFEKLQKEFNLGKNSTVYLLAERQNGWDSKTGLEDLHKLQEKLQKDSLVRDVKTIFTESKIDQVNDWENRMQLPEVAKQLNPLKEMFIRGDKLFIPITIEAKGTSTEAQDWVRKWSKKDLGIDFKLGGEAKFNQEIFDEISDKIIVALSIIIISTFFILMLAFRSILIPIKAILMNIIGLSSAFGILVYIFQYGHFGIEAGSIVLIIPVITFCLVFGLSMDYEVFLISRIQEEYEKGMSNTRATIDGLTSTSKIITSAALIMIVITGAFAFTDVMPVKQIGVGIAIAIAIDATIIRLMLVPSLMKLLGDWNWWMPFQKKKNK
ncbi:MMPL family transporter [Viridibacillus sp. YIM B01967]|uniref:MMPL family transporter n=1 Tax=Viridibacillus soli TaxID=2798301 RepID=A0ABS1H6D4_9BACL|nr:MMPL family transporter [Viridibacillus soli]MBK3494613.1 MMPL family transporter [Viridibacillus soli]